MAIFFFPAAQHRSQRPSPPFPARPSFAPAAQPRSPRRPSRASPAARTVPAQPRRTRQLPRPAADARAPPVGAVPYPARLGNRPLLALQQPPPRRASWARPPVALGLVKRQSSPPSRAPCCPRSVFASSRPQLPHGGAPPTTDLAVRVAVVSEPSPPPIFARDVRELQPPAMVSAAPAFPSG
ncbi:predicted GPI-anchored protein 58 [Miscanthus floridulus]|uniref:predicted GPI-anchored protein 58 n=1 Tax=Miscanthus floridulus TaxID=154761 RepID=UPI003458B4D7